MLVFLIKELYSQGLLLVFFVTAGRFFCYMQYIAFFELITKEPSRCYIVHLDLFLLQHVASAIAVARQADLLSADSQADSKRYDCKKYYFHIFFIFFLLETNS